MNTHPTALTIAGSDPSGGAGIQADLKTFSALGAYGSTIITALTAQNTCKVTDVHPVPTDFIRAQFNTLTSDLHIDSIKIGMLATPAIAAEVTDLLTTYQKTRTRQQQPPAYIVLDPVMVATSGDSLMAPNTLEALKRLIPLADVITPNLPEAATLLNTTPATTIEAMRHQATALLDLGATAVMLKGGHLITNTSNTTVDVFTDATGISELTGPAIATTNTHGTGCSLSSALAALRPQQSDWHTTAAHAKTWLTHALEHADALDIGHGHGPVHHFHAWWN
ncbi:bifunctional hydroxymethylpyrimidine kinase/phosphomethylpyrimidine kinase [Dermatophilus congolensis]|uniref:bifunctional hydroxymethylpyrimidine kinase/phosphomethylpyrimidine kinase n=1 Tax=Dermatophilus congolensis TaxID=1863 RepID=UPI001AAEDA55|nr:bifunctional hydroxymethylpyrimidine kinase/phosphomethylpyrimidine kinase [Dermatophilus congolensis]MBO3143465.1 bifunctional hydroxymethylpyrimidine kinase/phosphomethylpyrimidine kinase [Dermatophilus congolensis]MBO3152455.1 bifunctional hydroxymethylpyrimidine kinase/phosphomethylpyrimidine kinase [Dermatophilus congolensis]MBO3160533.1 bifunctional hydroxymethylpyrimidine kinase/phosphomethylpyrimidine kinase [Dermatophilus congolensis]MBO3163742.1 bifunctional hydroxymethylpyrimidine